MMRNTLVFNSNWFATDAKYLIRLINKKDIGSKELTDILYAIWLAAENDEAIARKATIAR